MKSLALILIALILFACGSDPGSQQVEEASGGSPAVMVGSGGAVVPSSGGSPSHDGTLDECSKDPMCRSHCCAPPRATGGTMGAGGFRASGGAVGASGGAFATGGTLGSGGTVGASGGAVGTGGSQACVKDTKPIQSVCDGDINPSCPVLPPNMISYCNVYAIPCDTTDNTAHLDFPGWTVDEIGNNTTVGNGCPTCIGGNPTPRMVTAGKLVVSCPDKRTIFVTVTPR